MMDKSLPSPTAVLWLILSLTLATSPHFLYQPFWVTLIFVVGIGWRCMHIWLGWPLPSGKFGLMRLLQFTIATIALLNLIIHYGNTIGRDSGVAFLVMMLGLKVTEIKSRRDCYVAAFLGYFVVITNFFFSQSMPMLLLMIIIVIMITGCLVAVNDPQHQLTKRQILQLSTRMLVQSLPVMLILFVLFPRVSGPLWGLPQDAHSGVTGIDNKMQLGMFSQLIQSDEVAFRADFDDELPPAVERYWRGPVLWNTNGTTWTELAQIGQDARVAYSGQIYRYSIALEPHNEHWLFALDLPSQFSQQAETYLSTDGQLKKTTKVTSRMRYQLNSRPASVLQNQNPKLLEAARALPKSLHPRSRQLAQQWRAAIPDDRAYIQHVLNYFNQQDFYYTLTPPPLTGDVIDDFLFESRRGFCEHFAASFTVLMRLAGIPARIVTGYQGGEVNPINGNLVIRQRDAHAWTEVWLADKGWLRIDPTAAVSRDRVELGMNEVMPIAMRSPLLVANSDFLLKLWQNLHHNWDALNSIWNLWVLAYSPERQRELLEKLGMKKPDWQKMVIWLSLLVGCILILLALLLFYQGRQSDRVDKSYQLFCNKLLGFNLIRKPYEGPLDFCQRATNTLPHHQTAIQNITELYIDLKYGKQTLATQQLLDAVNQFRPRPAKHN